MQQNIGNNFDEICRLCMKRAFILKPIFCDENDDGGESDFSDNEHCCIESVSKMIVECTGLEIHENDGFPMFLCNTCLTKLKTSYEFRIQCRDSADCLRKIKLGLYSESVPNTEDDPSTLSVDPTYGLDEFEKQMQQFSQNDSTTETEFNIKRHLFGPDDNLESTNTATSSDSELKDSITNSYLNCNRKLMSKACLEMHTGSSESIEILAKCDHIELANTSENTAIKELKDNR